MENFGGAYHANALYQGAEIEENRKHQSHCSQQHLGSHRGPTRWALHHLHVGLSHCRIKLRRWYTLSQAPQISPANEHHELCRPWPWENNGKHVIWNAMSNDSDSILPRLTTCKVLQLQLSAQLTWQSCPRKEQSRASPASMLKMCRRYVEDSRYLGYAAAISWAVGLLGCWIPLSARLHGRWVWHPRIVCCLNWDAASNLLAKIWSNAKNYYLFLEQFPEKVFPTEGLNRLPWVSLGHGCSDFWAWNLSIISVKRDNIPGVTVPKRSEMNSKVPWVGHIKHCKRRLLCFFRNQMSSYSTLFDLSVVS